MAQLVKHFVQDLQNDVKIRQLGTLVFNTDNLANVIEVELLDGGEAATVSGTVSCSVICSDGSTVPVTNGTISGNTVTVSLTADCGVIPGPIGVGIQITDGTVKTTVFKAIYNVELFETGTVVDPGSRITLSVSDLIDDIETAVASIPADYSDLLAAIAPAYSDLTFPVSAGTFCWYSGALYAANQDIPTSESWTSAHWKAVTVGGEIASLKSALSANGIATLITDGWITGKRMGTPDVGGTFSDSPGSISSWRYIKFECQPGDKFTINADGTSTFRTWAFADENLVCIARASLVNNDSVSVNETIVAPAAQGDYGDAKYLFINQDSSRGDCFIGWLLPGLLNAVVSAVAPVEASSTASQAYAAGDFFIYNGTLYIASASIAQGGTITPNTNCTAIPKGISSEVTDLKSAFDYYEDYASSTIGTPEVNITNLSGYTAQNGALGSDGTWANVNSSFQFICIPIMQKGCRVSITLAANSPKNLIFAGVTEFTAPVNGESYHASTFGRKIIAAGSTANYDLTDDTKYLILNTVWSENAVIISNFAITKAATSGTVGAAITDLQNAVGEVSSDLRPETDLSSVGAANKVYGLNKDAGETVSAIAAPQNGYTAAKIACLAGDEFTLTAGIYGSGGALDDVVAWGFVEQDGADLKMIEHSEIGTSCQNKKLIAPSDGFLMVNHYTSATYSLKMKRLFQVPAAPTANGNYVLTVAVSDGVPTYSWAAQS